MASRVSGKPEDILWPVTPRTVEAINTNFDFLFRDLRRTADGILTVPYGGTGHGEWSVGDLLYASDEDQLDGLADVEAGNVLLSGGVNAVPLWGKVGLQTHITDVLQVPHGGTGLSSVAQGDLLVASAADTLAALAAVAAGNVLLSAGLGQPPAYGKVGLTTHVSGILPIANGGTSADNAADAFTNLSPTTTKGDLITDDGTAPVRLGVEPHIGWVLTIDPDAPNGIAWARLPISSLQDRFLRSAASSDIAGYRQLTAANATGADVPLTFAGLAVGDVLLEEWATEPDDPAQDFLPDGLGHLHVHAQQTGGTRETHLWWELYARTAAGAETLLGTSEHSTTLTGAVLDLDIDLVAPEYDIDPTDRIVLKLYAHVHATGSAPTVDVIIEGTTAARTEYPVSAGTGGASVSIPLTTKGDLLTRDASNNVRFGVGADGTVLTADAAETTGLKWAAPSGVGAHDLMDSAVHSDVDSYLPTKGRLLVANDIGKWTVLERGTDGAILMVDATVARGVKWTSISGEPHALLSATHTDVDAAAVATRGSIIYGKATTTGGSDPFWVDGGQARTLQSDSVDEQKYWGDGGAALGFQSSTIGSSSTIRWAVLPLGVTGRVLRSDGVDVYWGSVSGIENDLPLVAKGDLLGHDGAALAKLPVGAAGYVLSVDAAEATGLKWVAPSTFASPLTTKGDLYGYTTEDARLPVGTNGYVLTADSAQAAGVGWQAPATALLTTKGDLLTRTGAAASRFPVGTNGDALVAASGASEGLAWAGFIRARVSRTVNITLSDATETTIDFTVEEYDSHNIHDLVTNPSRLTIPAGGAGTYLIVGQGSFAAPTGGRRAVWIFKNGSRVGISEGYTDTPTGSPLGFTIQATAVLALAVGDYVDLRLRQDSGVDDTILATGPDLTALQCIRLTTG